MAERGQPDLHVRRRPLRLHTGGGRAGARLDRCRRQRRWANGTSRAISRRHRRHGAGLSHRQRPAAGVSHDVSRRQELTRLADQLALLQTTGAAHDAIAEQMKIETEQAKLGATRPTRRRQAVAGLVGQIDAAKAAQTAAEGRSRPPTRPGRFGADEVATGIEGLILGATR